MLFRRRSGHDDDNIGDVDAQLVSRATSRLTHRLALQLSILGCASTGDECAQLHTHVIRPHDARTNGCLLAWI